MKTLKLKPTRNPKTETHVKIIRLPLSQTSSHHLFFETNKQPPANIKSVAHVIPFNV